MTTTLRVRPHPLGVVVFDSEDRPGELLLPGEEFCGVSYEELVRIAAKAGNIKIPSSLPNPENIA